jgi:hypothetical protein
VPEVRQRVPTTWSLTHFEPVCAWSNAEDLTAVEEQEGYGIIGRLRRQGGSTEQRQNGERSLREVTHPAPGPRFAVRRYGLLTLYWPPAIRIHPISHPVSLHRIARPRERSGWQPPAGNGSPTGRNYGRLPTGANGGSTFVGVRRRRSRRTTVVLTQIVEIIDANIEIDNRCRQEHDH